MEKDNRDTLVKSRSARAVIADGYGLYAGSFKHVFKRSWAEAVAYAAAYALLGIVSLDVTPRLAALTIAAESGAVDARSALTTWMALTGRQTVCLLLFVLAAIAIAACGFAALREHKATGRIGDSKWLPTFDRHTGWRTLKGICCAGVLTAVVFAIAVAASLVAAKFLSPMASSVLLLILMMVACVVALPIVYVLTDYVLNDGKAFWRNLTTSYQTGIRHWGFIFVVQLMANLVLMIATFFTSLPASILTLANVQANLGVLNGDPLGMPDGIMWLTAAVFVVAGFVQAYVHLSVLFPTYFMYGSIEASTIEK